MALITGTKGAYSSDTNKILNTQRATGMPEIANNSASLPITTTNLEVWCNNMKIGFVQTFNPSEQRTNKKIQELGTEGVVQIVPGNTNGGTLSVSRFAIYNATLWNALGLTRTGQFTPYDSQVYSDAVTKDDTYGTYGNPFKNLKDQRVPLEFQSKTKLPDAGDNAMLVLTYTDCWLQSYSKTIASQDITVTETASISYSDVYSSVTGTDS